jgi:5-methylcytosine-specific restriction enzyme B
MSRYCGEHDPGPILNAAEHWRRTCLEKDGAVFSNTPLWALENLRHIEQYFIDRLDEGEGNFFEKLEFQLAPGSPETKQLAAEMMWLMVLCPSNLSFEGKRDSVQRIWNWSGLSGPDQPQWMSPQVLSGIGSAGVSFNINRWRELVFFTRAMLAFKSLSASKREGLLADGWAFAEWLRSVAEEESRQLRHMILFLLFPDSFERIFGGTDRYQIASHFSHRPKSEIAKMDQITIDRELQLIRSELEEQYQTKDLDYYVPPLAALWKTPVFKASTSLVKRDHVLSALDEIDRNGIPPDAKSTTYDFVHGPNRYPPKYVLSLACKHASGKEFDRSEFSGGESSAAFKLLRQMGFSIERKDFVESLIELFLKQARAGQNLATKAYPKLYRGLEISVSFGMGSFAQIPWIAFLGPGQKTSKGIYPVYLFYRDLDLLVLAYGISESNPPDQVWGNTMGTATISKWFSEKYGASPKRYGASLVFSTYTTPDDIDPETLTNDLNELISEYESQLGSVPPAPPESSQDFEVLPPPLVVPYSLDEAMEGVFLSESEFTSIVRTWERKKNIVLQGPPGVGKSYLCRRLAYYLLKEKAKDRVEAVQFHQTYSYEDFVQGYRPDKEGFVLRNGLFHQFCQRARDDQDRKYVFIIDEINRGNLSKIFGELMMLIESDKRSKEWEVPLAYSSDATEKFYIPENVYLIGLMNTADRSLAMVDYALRRRFGFVTLSPLYESDEFRDLLLTKGASKDLVNKIVNRMNALNAAIAEDKANLGPGFCIGHSYFCVSDQSNVPDDEWYASIVESEIAPLLEEYWCDHLETANSRKAQLLGS